MSDALWSGKLFRTFNVIDDYNREALAGALDGVPIWFLSTS
jgi:putative transposase